MSSLQQRGALPKSEALHLPEILLLSGSCDSLTPPDLSPLGEICCILLRAHSCTFLHTADVAGKKLHVMLSFETLNFLVEAFHF